MRMGSIMLKQLEWGCEHATCAADRRKILNANLGALVGTVSVLFYGLIYLATQNAALIKAALVSFPFCAFYAAVPWLNRKGHVQWAAWLICFSLIGLVFSIMWVAQGTYLELHYYFLLLGLVPSMFFPLRQWRALVFLFVLSICLFVYAQYVSMAPDAAIYGLPEWLVVAMRASYKATTLLTMLFVVLLAEYSASTNEARLETLSATDRLTRVANRLRIDEVLDYEFSRGQSGVNRFAVILLDVDHFKSVNDTYGHPVGDAVLVAVSQVIQANVRGQDLVGRWGGEEFLVICRDATVDTAQALAEKLRSALQNHAIAVTGPKTASFGVTAYRTGDRIADVVNRADAALYRAKEGGRNRVVAD